ncbi:MAG: F0F1 ATP synthase subunit B [Planctomycetes bacterium]|nr:F0F1 ATP synthase subunit B [Planctomycetota bacterium]
MKTWLSLLASLGGVLVPLAALASEAAPGHEAPKGGLLDPHEGLFYWTAIIFVLTLAVLWRFAWGPILKGLAAREEAIRGAIEHAERAARDAEALLAEYRGHIDHAREEAHAVVEEGRKDAERLRAELAEQGHRQSEEMLTRARREIGLAQAKAVEEIQRRTTELACLIARRLVARELKPQDHEALLREAIERYETTVEAPD